MPPSSGPPRRASWNGTTTPSSGSNAPRYSSPSSRALGFSSCSLVTRALGVAGRYLFRPGMPDSGAEKGVVERGSPGSHLYDLNGVAGDHLIGSGSNTSYSAARPRWPPPRRTIRPASAARRIRSLIRCTGTGAMPESRRQCAYSLGPLSAIVHGCHHAGYDMTQRPSNVLSLTPRASYPLAPGQSNPHALLILSATCANARQSKSS